MSAKQLALNDVYGRLVLLLDGLAVAQPDGSRLIEERLTHQELANMIGARRQTVTTALNELHREGVLRRDQHRVVIPARPVKVQATTRSLFWASVSAGASILAMDFSVLS